MKVGIPRSLLYFKYSQLWEGFFKALGVDYVLSPDTNRELVARGTNLAVDESCLSFKIYLGHVAWLMDKCDMILVPRISNFGRAGTVCTRFQAIYDVVSNTFRDEKPKLLHYNIDLRTRENEMKAFVKMGKALGKKRPQCLFAYAAAKHAEKAAHVKVGEELKKALEDERIKILMVAHSYNTYDRYIGEPVIQTLRDMDTVPVIAGAVDMRQAVARSAELSDTVPWLYSKELLGAVALCRDKIDGIVLISTFPCGPDSMVNEIIIRRVKDKPILNLILDGQEGTAGLETRLESFVDIIKFKRNEWYG